MKVLPGAIAWILFAIATFMPQSTHQYATKTWKLDYKSSTYSTFITSLRTEIATATPVCNIQVTPQSPGTNDKYVYVDIITSNSVTITLAFKKTDVYYIGFKDKLNGKWRANFLNDDNDFDNLVKSDVFSDAKIRSKLPHDGGYQNLANVADLGPGGRGSFYLGVTSLASYINTIYGADYNGKNKPKNIGQNLAKFALLSIQMIAEATRFKYIENKVNEKGMAESTQFQPDTTFLELENNWDRISQDIHTASSTCGAVKVSPFPWDDIKPQMGLIKCRPIRLNNIHPFTGNDADADADAGAEAETEAEAEAALWVV